MEGSKGGTGRKKMQKQQEELSKQYPRLGKWGWELGHRVDRSVIVNGMMVYPPQLERSQST